MFARRLIVLCLVGAASTSDEIPVLGVASIFHAAYLLRCIRSIDFPVRLLVVVHNGIDPEVGSAISLLQQERPGMRVVRVPDNSGCAGGWNRIIQADETAPWWLVVNDDIAFPPGALATLAARVWERVRTQPAEGHFKFWYQHAATGWSCFALTQRAVAEVGHFDENIFPVYFEDQDFEWRLEQAGFASVHLKDVTVVHGAEDAVEYESGSMTALQNGTGEAPLREAFISQLLRGANRMYMLQKWGAIKPQPHERERRWTRPFNQQLPVSWWQLDEDRRRCIKASGPPPPPQGYLQAPCPFDESRAAQAAAKAQPAGGSTPERRLDTAQTFRQRLKARSAGRTASEGESSSMPEGVRDEL